MSAEQQVDAGVEQQVDTEAWPEHFPPDCPPAEAIPASGMLLRFARRKPPRAKDLTCNWQLYPKHRDTYVNDGRHCIACGLSVYLTVASARAKQRLLPALRDQYLHVITIASTDGLLLHTPNDVDPLHYTWWPRTSPEEQLATIQLVEGSEQVEGRDAP